MQRVAAFAAVDTEKGKGIRTAQRCFANQIAKMGLETAAGRWQSLRKPNAQEPTSAEA
ncbi:hypothetical protein KIN20_034198 [Parelaphostrongylus tenuis]|uniref:Uncharacterized protein n=1 Tax=Parelaphostrongylus tenuis TaxID=148309 RepID=A0AAD5R9R9_PARTN|nr:hypothetical protein KIN20_034198 [Parelaphostrongylus tenuis]